MQVAFQIPDDLGEKLITRCQDLPRSALEAFTADAYRNEILTSFEVQRILGLESRWETDALLKHMGALLHYDADDLAQDLQALDEFAV